MSLLKAIYQLPQNQNIWQNEDRVYNKQEVLSILSQIEQKGYQLRGKKIAIASNNSISSLALISYFSSIAKELFLVPMDPKKDTIRHLLESANSDIVVCDSERTAEVFYGFSTLTIDCQKHSAVKDTLKAIQNDRSNETVWKLATSGTTGIPKIFSHTIEGLSKTTKKSKPHKDNLIWGLVYSIERYAGLQVFLQALYGSSKLVIASNLSIGQTTVLFDKSKVNCLSATPSLWRKLLMDNTFKTLEMSQVTLGGEIADQTLLNMLAKSFPKARISHIYASTELGVGFSVTDKMSGFPLSYLKAGYRGIDIRVINDRLYLKSSNLPKDRDSNQDGFYDTGDLVSIRNDRVIFLGRANGTINVGGNKVSPEKIENLISSIPRVNEVVAKGRRSSVLGSIIECEIVADNDRDLADLRKDIQKTCKMALAPFEVPAIIKFTKSLPISRSGKLQR